MAHCRRRWTASEKARIVNETYQPARAVLAANSRRGIATVARAIGASRSALTAQPKNGKRGRKPLDDLLQEIRGIIDERASYGYRRAWGIFRRRRRERGECGPNHKRVYRVMKGQHLPLERSTGEGIDRHHDGEIAVAESNLRWCSDGLTIRCDNGSRSKWRSH